MSIRPDLSAPVDITVDGEYADYGEAKVVMTRAQLSGLAHVLDKYVDLDVVQYGEHSPELAAFLRDLVAVVGELADTASGSTST